jgi:hypothetical protein
MGGSTGGVKSAWLLFRHAFNNGEQDDCTGLRSDIYSIKKCYWIASASFPS